MHPSECQGQPILQGVKKVLKGKSIHKFIQFHYYVAKKIQFLNFQDVVLQLIKKKTLQHELLSLGS